MSDLIIKSYTLGELATNCYLIWDKKTLEAVIIDPADSGDLLSEEILANNLKLEKILLTHGHFDHILGLLEIKLNFPEVPIYLHEADQFLIKDAKKSAMHWLKRVVDPVPKPDLELVPGQTISCGSHQFSILALPGHTPGSIGFYSHEQQLLFSGDTLFKNAVGRTDFSYSDHNLLKQSLKTLFQLPTNTVVLAGHGDQTTIGQEQQNFN